MNRKIVLFGILLLSFIGLTTTEVMAKSQGTIYVNESANIEAAPDTVEFSVIVRTEDKSSLEKSATVKVTSFLKNV